MYMVLVSFRDNNGDVCRKEGKGTFKEVVDKLAEFDGKNVISAEIFHLI